MKKIIFRYSAMNSGKSANLILTYHNYKELGLTPIVVVPDNSRSKKVYSRVGISVKAIRFNELESTLEQLERVDCILVDEVQFLTGKEIDILNDINIERNIAIICYGLRTTSLGELFEGSKHLMAIADLMEELPTLCTCGNKARMNLRGINGKVDRSNQVVKLRDDQEVSYVSVCRSCFNKYMKDESIDTTELFNKFDNTKNTK